MKSTFGYVLRLAVTLLVITSTVALALAGINAITAPLIAASTQEKIQAAIETVLPGGGNALSDFHDDSGLVQAVYQSEKGYAVQVAPSGFDGAITMMIGIDTEAKVSKIAVISHTETAGLGAVCAAKTEAGQNFRGSFVGLSDSVKVNKDGPACHTGTNSCFTNGLAIGEEAKTAFSMDSLYELLLDRKNKMPEGSYTTYLFSKGLDKILKKIGEESTEVIIGAKNDKAETVYEIADLAYHVMVLMVELGISVDDIRDELASRHVIDKKVKQEKMK